MSWDDNPWPQCYEARNGGLFKLIYGKPIYSVCAKPMFAYLPGILTAGNLFGKNDNIHSQTAFKRNIQRLVRYMRYFYRGKNDWKKIGVEGDI